MILHCYRPYLGCFICGFDFLLPFRWDMGSSVGELFPFFVFYTVVVGLTFHRHLVLPTFRCGLVTLPFFCLRLWAW
jgi:hypothetical protein